MAHVQFVKGHGLGNDYLVFEAKDLGNPPPARLVRTLCDRHTGIGSDGILVRVPSRRADFGVRIFNPDGSEAEKSGNGLRIFSQYIHRHVARGRRAFTVETLGGVVSTQVASLGKGALGPLVDVTVDMGRASFERAALPMKGKGSSLGTTIRVGGRAVRADCVSVGNPHCVVRVSNIRRTAVRELGPKLEVHRLFPKRINVQFAEVHPPHNAKIEIWERGAGYTLASGTSACAVASVFVKLGVLKSPVTIQMPGGTLTIWVAPDFSLRMRGPAEEVYVGEIELRV